MLLVLMCFDVCTAAPFDVRRLRCQTMRFDVCSNPCAKNPKKVHLGNQQSSANSDFRLHTKRKSLEISYTLNPFFTTYSRSPRCSIPITYSFVTHHCSFVTL